MRTIFLWTLAAAIAVPTFAWAQEGSELDRLCYGGGDPEQTIVACTALIAGGLVDNSDLGAAFKNRGNAYADEGRYDSAIADYGHATEIAPGDREAFNDRGTSYSAKGQFDLAILDFDRALALNPADAMVLSNRCFAKAAMNRLEEALIDCNESLHLRPEDPSTFASRGFAYLRFEEAIADYNAEIRINPGNPYSLFGRGIARGLQGDLSGSKADIAAAKAISMSIAESMAALGVHL